jgi:fructose-1,6-bisphosphatase I
MRSAGYIMHGPSTAFAYTTGEGLHGFTLGEDIGEFVLTHPAIRCPEAGPYYSANLANVSTWPSNARRYIEHLTDSTEAAHAHSLRYSGALVADVHRTVLEGGIYLYPCDRRHPDGKLRLLYECAPLAFVVEQAGGAASTGRGRVLDVPIQSIHQWIPFAVGSRAEVERFDAFMRSGA